MVRWLVLLQLAAAGAGAGTGEGYRRELQATDAPVVALNQILAGMTLNVCNVDGGCWQTPHDVRIPATPGRFAVTYWDLVRKHFHVGSLRRFGRRL